MAAPTYAEHYQELFPLAVWMIKALGTVIVVVGGALVGVLVWLGRRIVRSHGVMSNKIDTILLTLHHCKNCSQAVDAVSGGRRRTDPEPENEGCEI